MIKRWYRIKSEGKLGGVCAGFSEMFQVDVTLIRVLWFTAFFTPLPVVLMYVIAWFIVPNKEEGYAIATTSTTATGTTSNKEFLAG